jgi:hypothetical protein
MINYNDILIMQYVLEHRTSVHTLMHPKLEMFFNMDSHRLKPDELAMHFFRLLKQGYIEVMEENDELIPYDLESIKAWLLIHRVHDNSPRFIYPVYGLTRKGGESLEKVLDIQWENYNYAFYGKQEVMRGKPYWMSLELGAGCERVMEIKIKNIFKNKSYAELSEEGWLRIVHPWNPMYWKELETGYCLQMLVKGEQVNSFGKSWRDGIPNWFKEFRWPNP